MHTEKFKKTWVLAGLCTALALSLASGCTAKKTKPQANAKKERVERSIDVTTASYHLYNTTWNNTPMLLFVDTKRLIVRINDGIYVWDKVQHKLLRKLSLAAIKCESPQGEDASAALVNEDGTQILIRRMNQTRLQYRYNIEKDTLLEQSYSKKDWKNWSRFEHYGTTSGATDFAKGWYLDDNGKKIMATIATGKENYYLGDIHCYEQTEDKEVLTDDYILWNKTFTTAEELPLSYSLTIASADVLVNGRIVHVTDESLLADLAEDLPKMKFSIHTPPIYITLADGSFGKVPGSKAFARKVLKTKDTLTLPIFFHTSTNLDLFYYTQRNANLSDQHYMPLSSDVRFFIRSKKNRLFSPVNAYHFQQAVKDKSPAYMVIKKNKCIALFAE
ncbi:MAG: hypothetical protein E7277_02040 [Lachnospiraceae bacterium]|nr:hypothetical protein [Lachnospiraceae bacterium]